ncbi:hypothetical protein jhhlp_008816 [Lomentospora prolificans]|uniref:Uncharacterized protein n=1 Tax=Lomentospora prolificans TaxID=41688 RepID=A0A2N3MZ37_9PEZI|nr:hypothetical protein jhhlp_008816 [Lomentospora prolificans]
MSSSIGHHYPSGPRRFDSPLSSPRTLTPGSPTNPFSPGNPEMGQLPQPSPVFLRSEGEPGRPRSRDSPIVEPWSPYAGPSSASASPMLGPAYPHSRASSVTLGGTDTVPPSPKGSSFQLAEEDPFTGIIDSDDEAGKHEKEKKKRRCMGPADICRALWAGFRRQISFHAIFEAIDIRDIFWPFSWRKYFVLLGVCACVAGIVVSNHYFHWIEKAMAQTRTFMLPVLVIVIGLEPLMILFILCVAKIPDAKDIISPRYPHALEEIRAQQKAQQRGMRVAEVETDDFVKMKQRNLTKPSEKTDLEATFISEPISTRPNDTALVLPCHNSDREALKRVLESAYPHFRPQDIFIVDNGRSKRPNDPTFRDWVKEQHPDLVYIWSPIGSKNAAQLVGSIAARHHKYILTVDDDVCIPANYESPEEMITDEIKAVALPLMGMDPEGNTSLFLVAWQDCEYRMAGVTKMAEDRICGVTFPHGAGWFVERDAYITMLSEYHPMDFIAEDVNSGLSFMRMGKQITMDGRIVLKTEVPTTILGPGLNWWKQRYKSWEMGRHGLTLKFMIRTLFSLNGQRTIHGILFQKFLFIYNLLSNVIDFVRIPIFVTMGNTGMFWLQACLLSLFSIIPILAYNYIKCRRRPDMRCRFWGAITFPIYKQLYSLVSIFGAVRCVLFYIGGHKMPPTVQEMIKNNDDRCIWLDPRFEENPGFLGDPDQPDVNLSTSRLDIDKST